jgi:hypothetical protein
VSDFPKTDIRVFQSPVDPARPIALYISQRHYESDTPSGVTFFQQYIGPGAERPCAARLSLEEAQGLLDSLWQAGLRPAEASGSTGQLAATVRHLEDMRAIAFCKTDVCLPEEARACRTSQIGFTP